MLTRTEQQQAETFGDNTMSFHSPIYDFDGINDFELQELLEAAKVLARHGYGDPKFIIALEGELAMRFYKDEERNDR